MKTSIPSSLIVPAIAALGLFLPGHSHAQDGSKATINIALTLTEEVGGFFVKTPKPKDGEEVSLPYGEIKNPRGFDPTALSPADAVKFTEANYYEVQTITKYRTTDSETGDPVDPTQETTIESRKLRVSKYGNAQFLQELVIKGVLPGDSQDAAAAVKGYSLVAVMLGDDEEGFVHFFAEKSGSAPVFIGSTNGGIGAGQDGDGSESAGYPLVVTSYGDVEAIQINETTRTSYKFEKGEDGAEGEWVAGEPKESYSETFRGQGDSQFMLSRGDGSLIFVTGLLNFSGRHDAKSGLLVNGPFKATVAGSAGVPSESSWSLYATAAGSISTSAFKVAQDLSAYRSALPVGE